jgi:5'-3' exonuclease
MYDVALIDTNTIVRLCFRNYEAQKALSIKQHAEYMAACYKVMPFFDNVERQIWFSDSKPYWRKNVYEQYKANRPIWPSELCDYTEYFNNIVHTVSVNSYEADDLIAAYVRTYCDTGKEKAIIFTVDSDLLQLISANCDWFCVVGFNPQFRDINGSMSRWFNGKISKLGKKKKELLDTSNPLHIVKYKVMCGDTSDNILVNLTTEEQREILIDLRKPPEKYDALNIPGLDNIFYQYKYPIETIDKKQFYVDFAREMHSIFPTINRLQSQTC